jgi:hypothetical protein
MSHGFQQLDLQPKLLEKKLLRRSYKIPDNLSKHTMTLSTANTFNLLLNL